MRCAAPHGGRSNIDWKQQDPQIPQSVWYHTDAQFSGFRIVRPLVEPSDEEKKKIWDAGLEIEGEEGRTLIALRGVKSVFCCRLHI